MQSPVSLWLVVRSTHRTGNAGRATTTSCAIQIALYTQELVALDMDGVVILRLTVVLVVSLGALQLL